MFFGRTGSVRFRNRIPARRIFNGSGDPVAIIAARPYYAIPLQLTAVRLSKSEAFSD
jgi:hypothetical protein